MWSRRASPPALRPGVRPPSLSRTSTGLRSLASSGTEDIIRDRRIVTHLAVCGVAARLASRSREVKDLKAAKLLGRALFGRGFWPCADLLTDEDHYGAARDVPKSPGDLQASPSWDCGCSRRSLRCAWGDWASSRATWPWRGGPCVARPEPSTFAVRASTRDRATAAYRSTRRSPNRTLAYRLGHCHRPIQRQRSTSGGQRRQVDSAPWKAEFLHHDLCLVKASLSRPRRIPSGHETRQQAS